MISCLLPTHLWRKPLSGWLSFFRDFYYSQLISAFNGFGDYFGEERQAFKKSNVVRKKSQSTSSEEKQEVPSTGWRAGRTDGQGGPSPARQPSGGTSWSISQLQALALGCRARSALHGPQDTCSLGF